MKKRCITLIVMVLIAACVVGCSNDSDKKASNKESKEQTDDVNKDDNKTDNKVDDESDGAEHYYKDVYVDKLFTNSKYYREEDELDYLRDDIQMDEINEIEEGVTTQTEVYDKLGLEHGIWGSGLSYYVYFTKDNHVVGILYDYDGEEIVVDAVSIEEWDK